MSSPAGLWLALGAVAAGARAETADELRALLGVAGDEAADAVTATTRTCGPPTRSPWRPAHGPARRCTAPTATSLPGLALGGVPDQAQADTWVREATGGLIATLPVMLDPDTALTIVNILALKARWEHPFREWSTRPEPFTDAQGVEHEVATMHGAVDPADAWRAPGGVRVVELRTAGPPYAPAPGCGSCSARAASAPAMCCLPPGPRSATASAPTRYASRCPG